MLIIIMSHEQLEIARYQMTKPLVTIGRRSDNDLVLSDSSISGKHAEILMTDKGIRIKDLDSTNGSRVNGRMVNMSYISPSDDIMLGRLSLKIEEKVLNAHTEYVDIAHINEQTSFFSPDSFFAVDPPYSYPKSSNAPASSFSKEFSAHASDHEKEDLSLDVSSQDLYLELGHQDRLDTSHEKRGKWGVLKYLDGKNKPKSLSLDKIVTRVGSYNQCIIQFVYKDNRYWLEISSGPEKPLLNGVEVSDQSYELFDGDEITVIGLKLIFYWDDFFTQRHLFMEEYAENH